MPVDCTDLDALAENAKCIQDATSPEQRQAMIVYVLATMAGASTDPNDLAENAKCILAGMSDRQMRATTVSLLCAILNL